MCCKLLCVMTCVAIATVFVFMVVKAIQCSSIPICPDGSAPITDDPFRCCPYCANTPRKYCVTVITSL